MSPCYTDQEVTLEKCSIWENTAAQHGGAIWNRGKLTITQSTIHNNTANGEPDDIVNEYSGHLALMDDYDALVALYATYGLIPNKWAVDTFIDESAERPNMVFSMSFATNDPEPSPEPEPEPAPAEPELLPFEPEKPFERISEFSVMSIAEQGGKPYWKVPG